MKIVVIDSGLNLNSPLAQRQNFHGGIEIYEDEKGTILYKEGAVDDIGHGTAVASYIDMLVEDAEIIPVKVMSNDRMASCNVLCEAFEYITNHIECDIVNISAGIVSCDDIYGLEECCRQLTEKGTVIVAAYDNGGAVSYPAAFDCVIGVDGARVKQRAGYYDKVEGNNADYVGCITEKRLFTLDGYEICAGNSFLAPEFVAKVAELKKAGAKNHQEVVERLNSGAGDIVSRRVYENHDIPFKMGKAIVFPFNKEMHSLARFEDLLSFEVVGYYDVKYSKNTGKKVSDVCCIEGNEKIVGNIETLNWDDSFDTVILGHTSIISRTTRKDYERIIIEMCKKHGKKLFSCRDIRDNGSLLDGLTYYCPHVDYHDMPQFHKMHVMGCPVVGVVGTGGSQGKFTMQLGLRDRLLKEGYKVAQLGTEPTAQLFGMDCVYPMGHESAVYIKGFDAVFELNCMMGYLQSKAPDIILFGNQSNSVPFHVGGPQDYPVVQHELLLGCQADAYILCVSDDATTEYIKRTISYLEGIYSSKVIAVVLSHFSIGYRFSTISGEKEFKSEEEMKEWGKELYDEFGIPVFSSADGNYCEALSNEIVTYFS